MRVLGIDHGTLCTGWGLLDISLSEGQLSKKYLDHGFFDRPKDMKYPDTLLYFGNEVRDLLATVDPACVALEAPKDNRGFKATQVLIELLGSFKYILMSARYPFAEIPPSTMKKIVTGYGWSTKEEVAAAISKTLELPYEKIVRTNLYKSGDKKGKVKGYQLDGSDALGLALSLIPYARQKGGRLDFECR